MTLQTRGDGGTERRVSRDQTWERGPPSALSEIFNCSFFSSAFFLLDPVTFLPEWVVLGSKFFYGFWQVYGSL